MLLTTEQTTFASGEIDPTLRGQTSLKAYAEGARRMRNCARRATGGVERRYGTYDVAALPSRGRMAEFEFSDSQRYVLYFYHQAVRVMDLNGTVLATLAAPWTADQAFELTYSQAGDYMVIAHQAFWPQLLRRNGPASFTLLPLVFDVSIDGGSIYQPHFKFVDANVALTPSAATGAITIASTADVFDAACIGQRWRIYEGEVEITAVANARSATATVKKKLEGRYDLDPLKTKKGSATIEVLHLFHGLETGASVTISGCNSVGFIPGEQIDGTHVVTVLDELRYEITPPGISYSYDHDGDSTTAPVTKTVAAESEDGGGPNVKFSVGGTKTRAWTEPAISARRGYPGGCCFHDGRLWLVGTTSQPDACFGSKSLFPFNFDNGKGYDGDSVQVASGTEDVSRIWHAVSNGELQLFTASRESIFLVRDGEPITPNNARTKTQSNSGTAPVQPVVFDGATLFAQENGLSVSEFVFSSSEGRFRATPISTLAGQLIRNPVSIATSPGVTNRAEQQAFFVNEDGTCAVFHSMRAENIAGWGLWTLGAGKFVSVAAIGPYVFFAVEVRGAFRLYRLSDNDLACLDGQVAHTTAVATASWVLDARVRGRRVGIRTELGYHGEYDVPANGAITLTLPVRNVVAGDPFFYELALLPPVVALPSGRQTGIIKRIVRTIVEFDETLSATVDGQQIVVRQAGEDFAAPISPVTGPREVRHLGFARDKAIVISQTEPLPARVLNVVQEVQV